MSLEIWGYIFGLIVGVFSVYNSRKTRKEMAWFIKNETQGLKEILLKISEQIASCNE